MSAASELKFVEQAERLARNLTSLQKRSFRLSRELDELRHNAQKQLEDLYRTEVRLTRGLFKVTRICSVFKSLKLHSLCFIIKGSPHAIWKMVLPVTTFRHIFFPPPETLFLLGVSHKTFQEKTRFFPDSSGFTLIFFLTWFHTLKIQHQKKIEKTFFYSVSDIFFFFTPCSTFFFFFLLHHTWGEKKINSSKIKLKQELGIALNALPLWTKFK